MARIVFNQARCTGCRACEGACKQENDLPVGVRWRVVKSKTAGNYPNLKKEYQHQVCRHCASPKCASYCRIGAIKKDLENGVVLIDEVKCNGCRECINACPFGAMVFNQGKDKAGKCTLCNNRQQKGFAPACVQNCLALALELSKQSQF
ncbi:MAG: 4Fe-4S dicluster domain-containing protein [Thermincolia bacterium]